MGLKELLEKLHLKPKKDPQPYATTYDESEPETVLSKSEHPSDLSDSVCDEQEKRGIGNSEGEPFDSGITETNKGNSQIIPQQRKVEGSNETPSEDD